MGQEKWTEAELANLTEEEREGLLDESLVDDDEGEDGDTEDEKAKAAIEGSDADDADDDSEDDDADDKTGDDDAAAKEGEAEAEKKAAEEADAGADDDAGDDKADEKVEAERKPKSVLPDWKAPEDVDAKIKELRQQQEELASKFDDGELTAKEFHAQRNSLDDQVSDLREAKLKASMSAEARAGNWFNNVVPDFLSQHSEYSEGSILYRMLDSEVRQRQHLAQEKGGDPHDPAILQQAHDAVTSEFAKITGQQPKPKVKEETPPAENKKVEKGLGDGKKREIPPTLAHVPASDVNDTNDGGKFAYLDRLAEQDGVAYEEALAKLSDAERESYLSQ